MPSLIDGPVSLRSLLRPATDDRRTKHGGGGGGGVVGLLKMFKLAPMLTTGSKMAALLGRHSINKPLLADHAPAVTLFGHRRGRLSLAIHEDTRAPPLYAVKRRGAVVGIGGSGGNKSMAHVAACGGAVGGGRYEVEGSYARRCCVVYDERRRAVAEVRPKEAMVGTDVFRMVVRPAAAGMDVSLAMAVVLALDEMFGKPSLLRNWSS
jgi:hypothetical protein